MRALLVLAVVVTCALGLDATAVAAPAELTAQQKSVLDRAPVDPPAKELLGLKGFEGRHYLVGDEYKSELWYPHVKDVGGGYVGIGSDQQYIFIGWARPDFAWLCDYDPLVVDLHAIHRLFFLQADTADAFIQWWSAAKSADAKTLLETQFKGDPKLPIYLKLYRENRSNVSVRLTKVKQQMAATKTPSYLTDADTYAYVRSLWQTGRMRAQSTNLLADKGLTGIAAAARELGVTIRTVYLSNAEGYWPYSKQFRANMTGLPFDDRTVILRTIATFSINQDYRYNVQPGLKYQAWLATPVYGVRSMIPKPKDPTAKGADFIKFDRDPPTAKGKPK